MLAMLFVTVLHIQGHGGMLSSSGYSLLHSSTVWGIEYAAYSAVNCFVLIAGYVGGNSRVKISRIVMLWMQVAFYSIVLTVLIAVLFPGTVSRNEVLKAIFPVMKGQYWFFTAYFGMYLLVPFLNHGIQELSQLQYRIALICGALFFSVLPAFLKTDTFLMDGGYHTLWFVYLYIAGAYVKRFGIWKKCGKWSTVGIYLLAVMIGWAEKMMVTYGASRFSWGGGTVQ